MRRLPAAVASSAAALALTGAPAAQAWSAPVVMTTGDYSDPSVDVDPGTGTIYVSARPGSPGPSPIWTAGPSASWWAPTPAGVRAALPGGHGFDLAVHDDGDLAFVDSYTVSASTARSDDMAATWLGLPASEGGVERPWLATAGSGATYLAYHQPAGGIVVAASTDGGMTYGAPAGRLAATVLDQNSCICPSGTIVAASGPAPGPLGLSDKVGVLYSTSTGVRFARSIDGAITWSNHTVDPIGGGSTLDSYPVVAHGGNDVLHAVWTDSTSTSSVVKYSRSGTFGATWSVPVTIASAGSHVYPWVAARGSTVAVAFYRSATAGNPNTLPGTATWFLRYVEGSYSGASGSTSWGTAQSPDPTAVKTGKVCTLRLSCVADAELGTFLQVALRPGLAGPVVAYLRVTATGATQVRVVTA